MNKTYKILVIVQRSNGDVFYSNNLIYSLKKHFQNSQIDLLINEDTYSIAKLIPNVSKIIKFSYYEYKENKFKHLYKIFKEIYKKYDYSFSLTASDRSILFAIISSKKSLGIVEKELKKSWWKKWLLNYSFEFSRYRNILDDNYIPLDILNIPYVKKIEPINLKHPLEKKLKIFKRLNLKEITSKNFIIFHPCAQYSYKVYPEKYRVKLLNLLIELDIPIVVTGSNSEIDQEISKTIPTGKNIFNLIGKTKLEDYIFLSSLSSCYIGMDTLNMHISASFNKQIFAIFGPTLLEKWSPWSRDLGLSLNTQPVNYDNIRIFQASKSCVPCGYAGCDDKHGESLCLNEISPLEIFREVKSWSRNL